MATEVQGTTQFPGFDLIFTESALSFCITGYTNETMRAAVETTCSQTAKVDGHIDRTYEPSILVSPGTLTLQAYHNKNQVVPIKTPLQQIDAVFPQLTGETSPAIQSFMGFITNYRETGSLDAEGLIECEIEIQKSGPVTHTGANTTTTTTTTTTT